MKMISAKDLKSELDKMEKSFSLIDIRDNHDYQEKHIPGSVNIPKEKEFLAELSATVKATDQALVLYDDHEESDADVEALCKQVEEGGYKDVNGLQGGLMAWMEAGGSVDFGRES